MTDSGIGRRVVVGVDEQGRSTVVLDGLSETRVERPNGAVSVEIWRQESLPVAGGYDGTRGSDFVGTAPEAGLSYRLLSVPANTPADGVDDTERVTANFGGPENVLLAESGALLHRTNAFFLVTVMSGKVYLVLTTGEVLLEAGDTFVLPSVMHTFRNPFSETALMVTAVLPNGAVASA
jgi:mannose-6-phosphate isomerase-like protein (cupin superfamily)